MEYIVIKRFKQKGIDGSFNLPYGTVCSVVGGFITSPDGRSICYEHSENGYTHFRQNTEEGRKRQIMLDKLYHFYEHGRGNAAEDFDPDKWREATNTYWKHILRTMPTEKLVAFYRERLGEPDFEEG